MNKKLALATFTSFLLVGSLPSLAVKSPSPDDLRYDEHFITAKQQVNEYTLEWSGKNKLGLKEKPAVIKLLSEKPKHLQCQYSVKITPESEEETIELQLSGAKGLAPALGGWKMDDMVERHHFPTGSNPVTVDFNEISWELTSDTGPLCTFSTFVDAPLIHIFPLKKTKNQALVRADYKRTGIGNAIYTSTFEGVVDFDEF